MLTTNKPKGEVVDMLKNKAKEKKFQDVLVDEKIKRLFNFIILNAFKVL
ncbi:MAG: hypothetical protein U5N58_03055 [Actinomycetota bacterium]|nr:hypothetical protein [Actinomycetota bacterium]